MQRFVALPGADRAQASVDARVQLVDEEVARLVAHRLRLLRLFLLLGGLESVGGQPSDVREAASGQADVSVYRAKITIQSI